MRAALAAAFLLVSCTASLPPGPVTTDTKAPGVPATVVEEFRKRGIEIESTESSDYGRAVGEPAVKVLTKLGAVDLLLADDLSARAVCEIGAYPYLIRYSLRGAGRPIDIDSPYTLYFANLPGALAITGSDQAGSVLGAAVRPPSCESLDRAAWDIFRSRDLNLPRLQAGGPCPISTAKRLSSGYGPVLGDGPIYPVLGSATQRFSEWGRQAPDGYRDDKVLWIAVATYQGPALARGGRIDGPGDVRFDGTSELRFATYTGVFAEGTAGGGRDRPSGVGFSGPGCYAIQIDGEGFTTSVVLELRP